MSFVDFFAENADRKWNLVLWVAPEAAKDTVALLSSNPSITFKDAEFSHVWTCAPENHFCTVTPFRRNVAAKGLGAFLHEYGIYDFLISEPIACGSPH